MTMYYPNMDLLRYVLTLAVIIMHTNKIAGYPLPVPVSHFGEVVSGFFVLSGFLMYPNFVKHRSFAKYTLQRVRRLFPPYVFIVIVCAIGFVFLSTLSPTEYFTSSGFWKYLGANLTFLNWLHPDLPGVFRSSNFIGPAVNGSLWTMKVEWCLYFSVPLFVYILSKSKFSKKGLAFMIIILSIIYRLLFSYLYLTTGKQIYEILSRQIFGQMAFFYCGMFIYFVKDKFIQYNVWMLIIGTICFLISMTHPVLYIVLSPVGWSILVMSLCFIPYTIKSLAHRHNISYEMYLFHFPIIKLSVYFGINEENVFAEYAFVMGLTILLSYLVNRFIDRRFIRKSPQALSRDNLEGL